VLSSLALFSATASAGSSATVKVTPNASGGGCPNINAVGNFLPAANVAVAMTNNATSSTYYFSSLQNESPVNGTPGLIEYCVYPETGNLPNATTVLAVGADGSSFQTVFKSVQGYFGYTRNTGDPSNIPLDGSTDVAIGTATWNAGRPANQTILLHINDGNECNAVYNDGSQTCFVYPNASTPRLCNGDAVCKSVTIDEAITSTPLAVPINTVLHIHYTYVIVNQPSNLYDLVILSHTTNVTTLQMGAKDFFTCEQIPDPLGSPGGIGVYHNYQNTSLALAMAKTTGKCTKWFITVTGGSADLVLHPGQWVTFTVDMTTRAHGFTGAGIHCINNGVQLRWYESDDAAIHTFQSPMVDVDVI